MNRDEETIDYTVSQLAEFWKQQSNLRLGQLIVNAIRPASPCPEIFTIEDNQLLNKIAKLIAQTSTGGRDTGQEGSSTEET